MRDFAEKFYKSQAWQETRDAYAKSKHWLCEDCAARGEITPGEIVHHVIELTPENIEHPDITLNWENLRLLCRKCHGRQHRKNKKIYEVDEFGHVEIF